MAQNWGAPDLDTAPVTSEVITSGQFATGIYVLTLCGTLYIYGQMAIGAAGRTGWVMSLPGTAVALVVGFMALRIVRAVPGKPLPDIILTLVGPRAGRVMTLLFGLTLMVSNFIDLRAAPEPIVDTFFIHTPIWAIVTLVAVSGTYLAWTGPIRMARLYPLFVVLMVLGLLLTLAGDYSKVEIGYLRPLSRFSPMKTTSLDWWAALLSIRSSIAVGFLGPYLSRGVNHRGAFLKGLIPGGATLGFVAALPVMVFGPWGAEQLLHPFWAALGTAVLPNSPVVRLEFVTRLLLQSNIIAAISFQNWAAASMFSRTLNLRDNLGLTLMTALPPFVVAGWMAAGPLANENVKWALVSVSSVGFVTHAFLWLLAVRHQRKGNRENPAPE